VGQVRRRWAPESAAADGVDDFYLVTLAQRMSIVPTARYDLVVYLHRNAPPGITGFVQELSHGSVVFAVARMAVQADFHPSIVKDALMNDSQAA
jgi:hypothetical protein